MFNGLLSTEPIVIKLSSKNIHYVDCHYAAFQESTFCKTEFMNQLLTLTQSPFSQSTISHQNLIPHTGYEI